MNTEIANAVNAAGDKAQYDTRVKRLLAQKSILAHILVKTVDEFKGMKPEDVVKYIEGEPSISVVPVEPGLANMEKTDATGQRIVGLNTENAENNEEWFDMIRYNCLDGIDFVSYGYLRSFAHKNLPIPYDALAGNAKLIQNPSYIFSNKD